MRGDGRVGARTGWWRGGGAEVARRAENDNNVLPLSKTATVALAGNSAQNTGNQCGGWTITWQGATGDVIPGATSVRTAMEAAIGTSRVVYSVNGSSTTGAGGGRGRDRRDAVFGGDRRRAFHDAPQPGAPAARPSPSWR